MRQTVIEKGCFGLVSAGGNMRCTATTKLHTALRHQVRAGEPGAEALSIRRFPEQESSEGPQIFEHTGARFHLFTQLGEFV